MLLVQDLLEKLPITLLAGKEGLSKEVTGCYIGDLLSWVMGRASEGDVWLTVMGNINAVAVSTLAGISCIILTEGASLDEDAKLKADQQGVVVCSAEEKSFHLAMKIAALLKQ